MSRPRGDKTSTAGIADRRAKVIEKANEGKTQLQIAAEVGASLRTIGRDFEALAADFQNATSSRNLEFRRAQLKAFELIERSLVEGLIDSETANAWRGIRSEISKLLGLNAPSTSITAHVSNPEHSREYLLFREACAGLDETQIQDVYAFARSIKRTWTPPPIEADFPPVKALPEATDAAD